MIPEISLDPLGLCFMETTYEEAKQAYLDSLETHVDPAFVAAVPKVMDLLRTKGLQVFVPHNWQGIRDLVLNLEFKPEMPRRFKPPLRRCNPELLKRVTPELQRLASTVWEPSNSEICSPIVIADKATAPFYRICGMYNIFVNKYIKTGHAPIPHVLDSLQKITGFKVFADLDMSNSFHQLPLSLEASEVLSLQSF